MCCRHCSWERNTRRGRKKSSLVVGEFVSDEILEVCWKDDEARLLGVVDAVTVTAEGDEVVRGGEMAECGWEDGEGVSVGEEL